MFSLFFQTGLDRTVVRFVLYCVLGRCKSVVLVTMLNMPLDPRCVCVCGWWGLQVALWLLLCGSWCAPSIDDIEHDKCSGRV